MRLVAADKNRSTIRGELELARRDHGNKTVPENAPDQLLGEKRGPGDEAAPNPRAGTPPRPGTTDRGRASAGAPPGAAQRSGRPAAPHPRNEAATTHGGEGAGLGAGGREGAGDARGGAVSRRSCPARDCPGRRLWGGSVRFAANR